MVKMAEGSWTRGLALSSYVEDNHQPWSQDTVQFYQWWGIKSLVCPKAFAVKRLRIYKLNIIIQEEF